MASFRPAVKDCAFYFTNAHIILGDFLKLIAMQHFAQDSFYAVDPENLPIFFSLQNKRFEEELRRTKNGYPRTYHDKRASKTNKELEHVKDLFITEKRPLLSWRQLGEHGYFSRVGEEYEISTYVL